MANDLDPLESVAASELVSSALIASLIPTLVERGVLTSEDAQDVYENALLMIETQQGSEPAIQRIYEAARELIEAHLRPE
jgi:glycerol-3-phosphate O-acyltransferase